MSCLDQGGLRSLCALVYSAAIMNAHLIVYMTGCSLTLELLV